MEVRGGRIEELKVTEGSRDKEVQGAAVPRILTVRNTRYVHQMNPAMSAEVGHIALEEHMDRHGRLVIGQYCLFLKDHAQVVREQCSKGVVTESGWSILTGQDGDYFAEMLVALEGFGGFRWDALDELAADQNVLSLIHI